MKSALSSFLNRLGLQQISTFCPVCSASNLGFSPLPDFFRNNAKQYGYAHFGQGEMTALETYSCTKCGASDRERLYAYWLHKEIKAKKLSKFYKAIHFAPEQALSTFIRDANIFAEYQTADLAMDAVNHKVDLMDLPFPENSFDFFICSHVLEHVPDDRKALRELHRITRSSGRGILMAPVIVNLSNTIEDSTATTEAERWRLFGQYDHVRLYAHDDYVHRITEVGFDVQQFNQKTFGERTYTRLGLKPTSILYIATKR
jgi:SAM-dependent methyltransferase